MKPKTPTENLMVYFKDKTYGDFISHKDIDRAMDRAAPTLAKIGEMESQSELVECMQKYQFELLAATDALKKYLLKERKMMLVSVRGEGYRIVRPNEQTDIAVKAGWKQIIKGMKLTERGVENVNTALLTRDECSYNLSVRARLAGLRTMIGRKRDLLKLT